MRKIIVFIALMILMSSFALGASISRSVASRVDPGSELTVTLNINGIQVPSGMTLAVEDKLPAGLTISDWSITGTSQAKADISTRSLESKFGWEFIPTGNSATITYTVSLPQGEASYAFGPLTWFDQSGMSPSGAGTATVTAKLIVCGDGACEAGEDFNNCASDCPAPATTTTVEVTTTTLPMEPEGESSLLWLWILIAVIVIVIGFVLFKRQQDRYMV